MSTFLFTLLSSNDLGVITRALPLARLLRHNGHTVIFSVYGKVPLKLVNEEGFPIEKIKTSWDDLSIKIRKNKSLFNYLKYTPVKEIVNDTKSVTEDIINFFPKVFIKSTPDIYNMEHFFVLNGMLCKKHILKNIESFIKLIKHSEADFVVDFWNPYASIAAKVINVPLITVNQFDVHPTSKGFMWWLSEPPKYKRILHIVNKILSGYGLKQISKFEEITVGDLTLTLGMPNKKEKQTNKEINHIGFLVYRKENKVLPEEINRIVNNKPIVWVYSGNPRYAGVKTDFDSEVLLDICVNTLAKEDINIVLTTGYHSIPKKYLPLPENIFYTEFIDGFLMSKKADVIIHHGGYGSCQTALVTGTPSVIIPTFSERESNARRIKNLGVGEFVLPIRKKYSKKKIVDEKEFLKKFRKVLNDKTYTEKAKEISMDLKKFNSQNRGIKLIMNFVNNYNSKKIITEEKKLQFFKEYSKNLKLLNDWKEKYKLIS